MIFPQLTERPLPGGGTTTLGGGTAISGGGTPDTGGGTPFPPVPAEFNHCITPTESPSSSHYHIRKHSFCNRITGTNIWKWNSLPSEIESVPALHSLIKT